MIEWFALFAVVVLGVAIDLVSHRGRGADSRMHALAWSAAWIGVSVAFGAWIFARDGGVRAGEFFSAYLVEKSLSIDNLLVFLLVFARLGVPPSEQRRVLFWGIAGAFVMRGAFVAAGAAALRRWHFILYGFGALLVFLGVRLASHRSATEEPRILRWLRKVLPMTRELDGHRFVVREDGRWAATPLLVALVAIELSDVLFAVDSIPAAFGVTSDPFLVYSSNILAILGLRALFVVVASALETVRFVHWGVAAILVFVGGKMIASRWIELGAFVSLSVIAGIVAVTVVASFVAKAREARLPRGHGDP